MKGSKGWWDLTRMEAPRQYRIQTYVERDGEPVRLSGARWRHIQKKHPEVSDAQIRLTLSKPDSIERINESSVYQRLGEGGMFCVAVRNVHGFVGGHFKTSQRGSLENQPAIRS
jgi:hypothetical protein